VLCQHWREVSVIGKTSDDGHNLLYLGISEWEPDVFQLLDDNVKD
jgi:hypothetical protein